MIRCITIAIGVLTFFYFSRKYLKLLLIAIRVIARLADMMTKAAPILAVAATIALAAGFDVGSRGVARAGLPDLCSGFVGCVSVGQMRQAAAVHRPQSGTYWPRRGQYRCRSLLRLYSPSYGSLLGTTTSPRGS